MQVGPDTTVGANRGPSTSSYVNELAGKEPCVAVTGLARMEERWERLPVDLLPPILHARHDPPRRRLSIILP